jgi:hypothetical protein
LAGGAVVIIASVYDIIWIWMTETGHVCQYKISFSSCINICTVYIPRQSGTLLFFFSFLSFFFFSEHVSRPNPVGNYIRILVDMVFFYSSFMCVHVCTYPHEYSRYTIQSISSFQYNTLSSTGYGRGPPSAHIPLPMSPRMTTHRDELMILPRTGRALRILIAVLIKAAVHSPGNFHPSSTE